MFIEFGLIGSLATIAVTWFAGKIISASNDSGTDSRPSRRGRLAKNTHGLHNNDSGGSAPFAGTNCGLAGSSPGSKPGRPVYKRAKGESQGAYNKRAHDLHREAAIKRKKESGQWLPKADYERKTGRPGRRD